MSSDKVVQRQVDAYNARDLVAFLATYSDDIRVFRMSSGNPMISGKDALKALYADRVFGRVTLRAEILSRIVLGNKVVDHERVTGCDGSHIEAVAVYEVFEGLIRCVWFFESGFAKAK